jgi:hypothetical protein
MISITIPEYPNRNLLVKWINSHQHHTCVYMGTVLFPFLYIIEQSKAPNSMSQSSPTHVVLFSFVAHPEYREVLHFSNTYPRTCTRVYLSTHGNIVMLCALLLVAISSTRYILRRLSPFFVCADFVSRFL